MRRHRFDTGFWAVALSALIASSGISLCLCPTARAHDSATHAPTEASKTAMMLQPDDDGDELLEHWSDPKFSHEERLQTAGIVVLLACAGGVAASRRRRLARGHRHD